MILKSVGLSLLAVFFGNVYTAHKVTREEFKKSYDFYCLNPGLLEELYQYILDDLSRKQAELLNH